MHQTLSYLSTYLSRMPQIAAAMADDAACTLLTDLPGDISERILVQLALRDRCVSIVTMFLHCDVYPALCTLEKRSFTPQVFCVSCVPVLARPPVAAWPPVGGGGT